MNIEMLDTLEDRMAALVEEQNDVRKGVQSLIKHNPNMRDALKAELRLYTDKTLGDIRHELSLLVQENESKNSNRNLDSTRDSESNGHPSSSPELNPSARDKTV